MRISRPLARLYNRHIFHRWNHGHIVVFTSTLATWSLCMNGLKWSRLWLARYILSSIFRRSKNSFLDTNEQNLRIFSPQKASGLTRKQWASRTQLSKPISHVRSHRRAFEKIESLNLFYKLIARILSSVIELCRLPIFDLMKMEHGWLVGGIP